MPPAAFGLLDPGATMTADGGGLVSAALRPIEGRPDALISGLTKSQRLAAQRQDVSSSVVLRSTYEPGLVSPGRLPRRT
jgi:hypothetical protein